MTHLTAVPPGDPVPAFRSFCQDHRAALIELVSTGLVQTNEPQRCTVLLPAFATVARLAGGTPLALIEVGASAGLNLLFDRYGYGYGTGRLAGDPNLAGERELGGSGRRGQYVTILSAFQNGRSTEHQLAYSHPHGAWLEWLDSGVHG